jgi:hypothetical protein
MSYRFIRAEKGPLDGPFLENFNLQVCIPSTDVWDAGFAMSLLQMQMQLFETHVGKRTYFNVNNRLGSMLSLNREELILNALEVEPRISHILMLDSDMTFPADTAHWLAWRNEPIVLANYVKRVIPTLPTMRGMDGRLLATLDHSTGLQPVKYGGLGVCMVHREVFERVPRPWFHFEWYQDAKGVWKMRGEDVYFFDKCREHGYQVLCDHDLSKHVTHRGAFEYTHRMAFLDEDEDVFDGDGRYTPEAKIERLKAKEEEAHAKSAA